MTTVVIPVAEDQRRTLPAICRNAAILIAVVVGASWLVAAGLHHVPATSCRDVRHEVAAAEAKYHAAMGSYTDTAGLHYAGYLTDSPWPLVQIRLQGPAGAATSYSLPSSRFC